jgi:hypothetical protein
MERVSYPSVGLYSGIAAMVGGVILLIAAFVVSPILCGSAAAGPEVQLIGLAIFAFGSAIGLLARSIPAMFGVMTVGVLVLIYGLILATTLGCLGV